MTVSVQILASEACEIARGVSTAAPTVDHIRALVAVVGEQAHQLDETRAALRAIGRKVSPIIAKRRD